MRPIRASSKLKQLILNPLLRFAADESGSYLTISAVLMPAIAGVVGLGTEYGMWIHSSGNLRSAADTAALSAAVAYTGGSAAVSEASAVAASYGLVNGMNGVVLAVHSPPASGTYAGTSGGVEVIIQQQQKRLFSALWNPNPVVISARSVALAPNPNGCVLATDRSASGAATFQGSTQVVLNGCSLFVNSNSKTALNIGGTANLRADSVSIVGGATTTAGITANQITTNASSLRDPYQDAAFPSFSGCNQQNFMAKGTVTIDPGVYCGGMNLNAGAIVSLNPGIYYIDGGTLKINGGAALTGAGVTLIFTSSSGSNWPSVDISGNATVNLVAPSSGAMAGFALFGDRRMPVGTSYKLNGGSQQYFGGAVYLPEAAITYSGGSSGGTACTQLIGDTISFSGNSNLSVDCSHYAVKPLGATVAKLVE